MLRRTANKGGFEAALAEIQDDYERSPTPENKAHLDTLQSAITTMFSALEAGFANRADWNFRHTVEYKIAHFLSGFDGIFTLNQDLLFERHYHDLDFFGSRHGSNGQLSPNKTALLDFSALSEGRIATFCCQTILRRDGDPQFRSPPLGDSIGPISPEYREKLMQLKNPRRGSNLLVSRATAALGETLGKAKISEATQMKIIEHVVLILDDAAHAANR